MTQYEIELIQVAKRKDRRTWIDYKTARKETKENSKNIDTLQKFAIISKIGKCVK
jgi:hypothetical protein